MAAGASPYIFFPLPYTKRMLSKMTGELEVPSYELNRRWIHSLTSMMSFSPLFLTASFFTYGSIHSLSPILGSMRLLGVPVPTSLQLYKHASQEWGLRILSCIAPRRLCPQQTTLATMLSIGLLCTHASSWLERQSFIAPRIHSCPPLRRRAPALFLWQTSPQPVPL